MGSWTEEQRQLETLVASAGLCRSHTQHLRLEVPLGLSEGTKHARGKALPLVGWARGGLSQHPNNAPWLPVAGYAEDQLS